MKVFFRRYLFPYLTLRVVFFLTIAYFVLMVLGAAYVATFSKNGLSFNIDPRERNAAIGMPLLTAYSILCNFYLFTRAKVCLFEFLSRNKLVWREKWVLNKLVTQTWTNVKLSAFIGLLITFIYLYTEGLLAFDLDPLVLFLNITAIPFWATAALFVFQLIFITRLMITRFLDRSQISMFGNKKLMPISDLVISNIVMYVLYMAFIPIMWIGKDIPFLDRVMLTTVTIVVVWLLFRPVINVHRDITRQKTRSIERINASIFKIFDEQKLEMRRLTDDPDRLRRLSGLVALKQEVSHASEWPIDLPQSIRGVLVAISVPLSWAIGSIIESYISRFM